MATPYSWFSSDLSWTVGSTTSEILVAKPELRSSYGSNNIVRKLAKSGAGTLNKHGKGHQPKKPRNRKGR